MLTEVAGTTDDAESMRRALVDPEQFAVVFDRHFAAIHRYLARRVGRQLADDLAGETFLIALRRLRSYDPARGNVRPWLYGIATNLLRRHRRTELRQYLALARTGVALPVESHDEDIAARITAQGMARALSDALMTLSAGERDVLLLVAWADLAPEEIALALHIKPGTVRVRLHRARGKIRAALHSMGETHERP